MAPDDAGTRQARALIESASLLALLGETEVKRAHELLADAEPHRDPADWRELVAAAAPQVADRASGLVDAFDLLAECGPDQHDCPPALVFTARVAEVLDGSGADLESWLDERVAQLALTEELRTALRSATTPSTTGTTTPPGPDDTAGRAWRRRRGGPPPAHPLSKPPPPRDRWPCAGMECTATPEPCVGSAGPQPVTRSSR